MVLGNGGFASCRKQGILTKTAKMTSLHSTHKNKVLVLPENDENDENGRWHSGKTMFTESGVFTTPIGVFKCFLLIFQTLAGISAPKKNI